ncbi:hypothetical protein evm_012584 [Chilo suppressalis]|nr:hypothetical protein evm_012584 [Chilo suppressalis]
MRLNENSKIIGKNVYLVPYRREHVPKYHQWMTNEELRKLTASEPLTLEEEYEMQKSWHSDEDKCTFIILNKAKFDETSNDVDSMIGDTNIFIQGMKEAKGEIEIMIAEESVRGKKLGWESVILMLLYGILYIGIKSYEAKICLTNVISIQMFKKLGFEEYSKSEVFQEITFKKDVSTKWNNWLQEQYKLNGISSLESQGKIKILQFEHDSEVLTTSVDEWFVLRVHGVADSRGPGFESRWGQMFV